MEGVNVPLPESPKTDGLRAALETAEYIKEAHDANKGGAWKDEELEEVLGWKGEMAGGKSKGNTTKTHRLKTQGQEDRELLQTIGVGDPELTAFTRQVEHKMLRNSGRNATSLLAAMSEEVREKDEKIKSWIAESTTGNLSKTSSSVEKLEKELMGFSDRLSTLEKKIDEILATQIERTEAESLMINEAHAIIVSQRRADAQTDQTPSIVGKLAERADVLDSRLQHLNTLVDSPSSPTQAGQHEKRKKKFGTLF
jgi:hypothetical protein